LTFTQNHAIRYPEKVFADVRADTIVKNPDLMKKWKEAGLYAVVIGFEDFQDARLDGYNKKYQGARHP